MKRLLSCLILFFAVGCGSVSAHQVRDTACTVVTRVCTAAQTACAATSGGN